ncbi:MAG: 50S ribosomal protein L22 [Epulopiscium sp.]|nr:50S ribosomal protein L22 [Candidatus Epulonipiscium sp.]
MAKGHRSQIKRERNKVQRETRPHASVSYAKVSSTKAKIVLDTIKGKNAAEAAAILAYTPRNGARIIEKVLRSAMANAENNLGMDPNALYIEEAFANQGPKLKRIRPRAQGRAFRIERPTSHISIILNER